MYADSRNLTRRDLLRSALGAATLLTARSTAGAAEEGVALRLGRGRAATGGDLDVAVRAERWIRASRVRTPDGLAWPADPRNASSVGRDFYNGTPGVVLFLLELYDATGDRAILDDAIAGARDLEAALAAGGEFDGGLYTGAAGIGFVLAETWKRTGDARHRAAAKKAVALLRSHARPAGAGVEWSDSADIISGGAGITLFLLRAARDLDEDGAIDLAAKAGRRLATLGRSAEGGLKWAISPAVPALYPNFSHGTAGAAYTLATLYGVTREKTFLDTALAGTTYLEAVADRSNGACKVFHHEPDGLDLYYLSWCHGGAGTARLYYRLSDVTGEAKWLDGVHCFARGITAMGAPVRRSPGYWQNISQCCGNAGVGEFFLSLHRLWPDRGYLEVARQAADDILERGEEAGPGMKWVQAEHRVRPEFRVAQTGRMQGAAGVGSIFLRLDGFAAGREPRTILPDSPWT
jgi:lantibiotic modifying enzyme